MQTLTPLTIESKNTHVVKLCINTALEIVLQLLVLPQSREELCLEQRAWMGAQVPQLHGAVAQTALLSGAHCAFHAQHTEPLICGALVSAAPTQLRSAQTAAALGEHNI